MPPIPHPAPAPDDPPLTLHVRATERRAELLTTFRRLRDERDEHAERCHARGLDPNPCLALWALDGRIALLWAELDFLGASLADAYAVARP